MSGYYGDDSAYGNNDYSYGGGVYGGEQTAYPAVPTVLRTLTLLSGPQPPPDYPTYLYRKQRRRSYR